MRWLLALWLLALSAMAQTHTVAPGETLFSIARRYGTTVEALVRLNGLSDPNRIRAGQVLRVRPGEEVPLPRGRLWYALPVQGRAFGLRVAGYREGWAEFLGVRYPLWPGEEGLWGLLAVGALQGPGEYPLRLHLEGEEVVLPLRVAPGGYGQETLALSPTLEGLLQDPGLKAERERVVAACSQEGPLRFRGAFLRPLEGGAPPAPSAPAAGTAPSSPPTTRAWTSPLPWAPRCGRWPRGWWSSRKGSRCGGRRWW
ncbi:LysM peptidoglycan-binding domain-containing protein [Thermus tengchongensis]|uniref:LysM peptidoglycan-binding domain-containing protein n=1 Tax=Thermus tengchongensis TaxID=1214928 RepID=UPI0019809106|nr:LysM domain-containing protein [Thermus tengchongensis]